MKDKAKKKACTFLCFKKNFSEFYKRNKRLLLTVFCICIVLALIAAVLFTIIIPKYNYDKARDFISSGKYAEAYERLIASGDYENAEEMKKDFLWVPGKTVSTYSGTTGVYSTVNEYDENGNCIMQITTNPDYEQSITESTFDKKGDCIKKIITNPFETKTAEMTYQYDKNLITSMTVVSAPGAAITSEYEYDENGNCIKNTTILPDGRNNIETTTYNKSNNPVKRSLKTASGYEETTLYTYDKKGNLIKQVTSGKSGEVNETVTNKYDKNGNLIKKTSVKSDGTTETVTYKLNKNGIVEKEIITDNNGNTSETVYSDYKVFYKN